MKELVFIGRNLVDSPGFARRTVFQHEHAPSVACVGGDRFLMTASAVGTGAALTEIDFHWGARLTLLTFRHCGPGVRPGGRQRDRGHRSQGHSDRVHRGAGRTLNDVNGVNVAVNVKFTIESRRRATMCSR